MHQVLTDCIAGGQGDGESAKISPYGVLVFPVSEAFRVWKQAIGFCSAAACTPLGYPATLGVLCEV